MSMISLATHTEVHMTVTFPLSKRKSGSTPVVKANRASDLAALSQVVKCTTTALAT